MRRLLAESPLLRSLRALSPRRERGAALLYLALALVALVSLATPLSRDLTSELIAAHHFRPKSWPAWAALQLAPKMYSFAHTCWIGPAPLLEQEPRSHADARFQRESFWVNHYPARKARFDGARERLEGGPDLYVYCRTTYFDVTETTGFQVRAEPGRLLLTPREVAP